MESRKEYTINISNSSNQQIHSIKHNFQVPNIINILEFNFYQLYNYNDNNLILILSNTKIFDYSIYNNKLVKKEWETQFGNVNKDKLECIVAYDKFKVSYLFYLIILVCNMSR